MRWNAQDLGLVRDGSLCDWSGMDAWGRRRGVSCGGMHKTGDSGMDVWGTLVIHS